MKCEDCKHWFDNGTNLSSCDRDALLRERDFFCAAWERKKPFERPDTNTDRIRSMSDAELAEWMATRTSCMRCPVDLDACHNFEFSGEMSCEEILLSWLRSPVEEVKK